MGCAERQVWAAVVNGIVRDSVSTEGIPYASVMVEGMNVTTVTDSLGLFTLNVPESARFVRAASQGYATRRFPLWQNSFNLLDINLPPQPTELREVEVRRRYSKRNNPAVDFVRRLRANSSLTDPLTRPYYSYDSYQKISFGINDYDTASTAAMNRRMPLLTELAEVSPLTGKTVLTLSVNEKAVTMAHRADPEAHKETVHALRQRGVDQLVDMDNMQTVLFDMLRDVNLWDNDIMLLRNSFVSPLSPIAPDFYRFYLVDTEVIDGDTCAVLAFYPRNSASTGFAGHIYAARDDSAMFVHRVELYTRPEINLNFIDRLTITQNFQRGPGGERLKTADDLVAEMRLLPGTPQVYMNRRIVNINHSFSQLPDSMYSFLGDTRTVSDARDRDSLYWESLRSIPESNGERRVEELMARLRSMPLYYWGELILQRMFTGYWPTGKPSKFDIGPLNTIASYNSLEGLRLRAGGMTTASLSRRWFGRGYVAYGFRDHRWKYGAEVEYSFTDKRLHSREFPVHSLRLSHSYDVDRLGSHYLFTSSDNFVLSFTRMADRLETYRRQTRLLYTLELGNHFSVEAAVENTRQMESPYIKFETAAGTSYGHYTQNTLEVQLRYAPGETFIQERTGRFPANLDAPVFVLRHRWSPRGFLGSRFAVGRTEFSFSKRFWLSVAGLMDVAVGAGHVWTSSPFPELLIPNANLSYTIQPESYALMNPMEFINSSFVSWDLTYRPQGLLLNLIPGVKKLGLREIIGIRGLYGHLARKSTPSSENGLFIFPEDAHTRPMDHGPYMELSAGLDNLFRCLRVDYVWRLTYRSVPYSIDRSGVRVALHLTF